MCDGPLGWRAAAAGRSGAPAAARGGHHAGSSRLILRGARRRVSGRPLLLLHCRRLRLLHRRAIATACAVAAAAAASGAAEVHPDGGRSPDPHDAPGPPRPPGPRGLRSSVARGGGGGGARCRSRLPLAAGLPGRCGCALLSRLLWLVEAAASALRAGGGGLAAPGFAAALRRLRPRLGGAGRLALRRLRLVGVVGLLRRRCATTNGCIERRGNSSPTARRQSSATRCRSAWQ